MHANDVMRNEAIWILLSVLYNCCYIADMLSLKSASVSRAVHFNSGVFYLMKKSKAAMSSAAAESGLILLLLSVSGRPNAFKGI